MIHIEKNPPEEMFKDVSVLRVKVTITGEDMKIIHISN